MPVPILYSWWQTLLLLIPLLISHHRLPFTGQTVFPCHNKLSTELRRPALLTEEHSSSPPLTLQILWAHTCMLKPIFWGGQTLWLEGDSLEGGKYEVFVLTGGEMTKAEMMRGRYYCWHSTESFHRQRHFTALSCRLRQNPGARQHKILQLSKTWLIQPGTALAEHSAFVDCIWQMKIFFLSTVINIEVIALISRRHLSHD